MLRISYQRADGHMHMVEIKAPDILKRTPEELAKRYGEPAFAVIKNAMRAYRVKPTVKQ